MKDYDFLTGGCVIVKNEILSEENISILTELTDIEEKIGIEMRWDGCCDIRIHYNNSTVSNPIPQHINYIHICELKKFIEVLESAYNIAVNKGYEVQW